MLLTTTFTEKRMLSKEQVVSIVQDVQDLSGYLFMNRLEKNILNLYGADRLESHHQNIAAVAMFIIYGDMEGLYTWYEAIFMSYMTGVGYDVSMANGINMLFAVWVHIANKIIRRNVDIGTLKGLGKR